MFEINLSCEAVTLDDFVSKSQTTRCIVDILCFNFTVSNDVLEAKNSLFPSQDVQYGMWRSNVFGENKFVYSNAAQTHLLILTNNAIIVIILKSLL